MYNTVIGVGAAVLAGGVALYTGYQLIGRDAPDEAPTATAQAPAETGRRAGGRGVPEGERALDFAQGAEGERVARAEAEIAAERAEAERLAALGSGGVVGDLSAPEGSAGTPADPASGTRPPSGDTARAPRGLRGAPVSDALTASEDDAMDRAAFADASSARPTVGAGTGSDTPTAPNAALRDKPDVARNRAFVDKPDTRLARLVAKPDDGPSYAASDPSRSFDPCIKADGTPYVGPGTAINPFSDGDPCLPRATGQAFEVAMAPGPYAPATASGLGRAAPRILPFVDLVTPGFIAAPPVGGDFGSDYAD